MNQSDLIKVTINGRDFQVAKGARLIDVCRENQFDIPSFCYYADLALQASCRMCLVRIEKMPKLQTSCTIICTDGMVVTTQSEEIEKAQRSMLEFLLANHPLDCPVCDRGGECELQELTFDWGNLEERFTEKKNYHPEKYLSAMVANDPQRCILCKRCTRVCDEWMGEDAIEAGNRGSNTVIGTYGGWLNCSECGNCIEVCPTGTLLDGTYRHQARPWELTQTISTCTYCSDGCQMSLGSRADELMRIVARDRYVNGLNGEFLCIKGRFGHPFVNHEKRLRTPLIRYQKGGKLIPQAVRNGGAKFILINSVRIRLREQASQFIHLRPGTEDAAVLALFNGDDDSLAAQKLGIDTNELETARKTIKETQGEVVIMFGAELSSDAQAVVAQLPYVFAGEGRRLLLHPLPLFNNSVGEIGRAHV